MTETLLTAAQVRERLREACKEAGSQSAWARKVGISKQFLSTVLLGHVDPTELMAEALGLTRVARYVVPRTIDEARDVA